MDRLDAEAIKVPGVEVRVVARCDSTNSVLLGSRSSGVSLLAAEEQTAGRGRRGRRWLSEPGRSITFSLARPVARPVRELAALSLVAGVAVVRALRALGARRVSLKWPNDLVVGDAKLGGILVETRSQHGGTRAVIGVGINWRASAGLERRLRRPVASLEQLVEALERNSVIEAIAAALIEALAGFEACGLDSVRDEWEAMDAHAGRRLRVRLADGRTISGVSAGLAEDGGLRLRTRAGLRAVANGRVVSSKAA